MSYDIELVGKIGSMALIREAEHDINYNVFSRIGSELRPGMIWVSSGAVEIGRLDYIKRTGHELDGSKSDVMTDYSSQGQAILMEEYRATFRQNTRSDSSLSNIRILTTTRERAYLPVFIALPQAERDSDCKLQRHGQL
jgi:glutamate 5-kinase